MERQLSRGHIVPFVVWVGAIAVLTLLERLVLLPPLTVVWVYAFKTIVCGGLFLWLRPWRVYQPLQRRNVVPAVAIGLAVALLWIAPETEWLGGLWPAAQQFYHKWLILMPGGWPEYFDPAIFPALPPGFSGVVYDPAICGWPLTLMRVVGSVMVIAVIEEFFFRGFLLRWIREHDFWKVPLTQWHAGSFWTVVVVFGFEHDRWLVGLVAGVAYGLLALKRGDIWATALAHVVTNGALAGYVLMYGRFGFW
ncbi:MAG: CAAX prenyl protease-related protein [Lentisphaerae bacterium]|jgi:membrane protease YdiL (CAAX protease family)|nr:CAAX prenyl protease-related protein [Lentisphaerota bacterium]